MKTCSKKEGTGEFKKLRKYEANETLPRMQLGKEREKLCANTYQSLMKFKMINCHLNNADYSYRRHHDIDV